MSTIKAAHLLERIEEVPYAAYPSGSIIVPYYDHSVHIKLAYEAGMSVGRHGGADLVMVVDGHTAKQLHLIDELRRNASQVLVFGEAPGAWLQQDNVHVIPYNDICQPNDHVFVLISSELSVAVLGSLVGPEHDDDAPFKGGWTVQRLYVGHAIEALLEEDGRALLAGMTSPDEGSVQVYDLTMRLMTLHANALANRQEDITMDKNDLFSVLNILKAISTKRRAHDILYVFVEQIARVVSSDRCSVVRIWGGAKNGLVLASHEDANITDRKIELSKYPELQKSLLTRDKVVINDVRKDPLTADIADILQKANINAILVIPIVLFDENVGSLFLRASRSKYGFAMREISFFEIVTEAAANALERAQLFETIQVANENLERLAITDGLTGLFNHRHFRDRLEQELERALRYRLPLSCLMFDIDNFKKFNDTYGHLLGDEILKEIADHTVTCIRKTDICARYGGEEFIVIMPQTGLDGAMTQAERIRAMVESAQIKGLPEGIHVTISVGVALLDFDEMLVCEDLLRATDQALYKAKRTGKNRVIGPEPQETGK